MRKFAFAALAATLLCSSANAVNTLTFTFATPTQNITTSGGTSSFAGTVTASASNAGLVYINGDGFSASTPLSVNDDPFFYGFPYSLNPGESYSGNALDVSVPASSSVGTYTGSFYILGGDTEDSSEVFGDYTFAVNVTSATVPEPAAWAMMITGFGMVGAAMRRRSLRVAAA